MNCDKVRVGLIVRTNKRLGKTIGFSVVQKHLDARKPNKAGVISGYVPGHGGDVWWVKHNDGTTGAYVYNEFRLI